MHKSNIIIASWIIIVLNCWNSYAYAQEDHVTAIVIKSSDKKANILAIKEDKITHDLSIDYMPAAVSWLNTTPKIFCDQSNQTTELAIKASTCHAQNGCHLKTNLGADGFKSFAIQHPINDKRQVAGNSQVIYGHTAEIDAQWQSLDANTKGILYIKNLSTKPITLRTINTAKSSKHLAAKLPQAITIEPGKVNSIEVNIINPAKLSSDHDGEAIVFNYTSPDQTSVIEATVYLAIQAHPVLSSDAKKIFTQCSSPKLACIMDKNQANIIQQFLKQGIEMHDVDSNGETVFFKAAYHGQLDIVKQLLASGHVELDRVNAYGRTALMVAAMRGNTEVVQLLLKHGANVNHINKSNETALLLATNNNEKQYFDIVSLLLAYGANVNHVGSINNYNAQGYNAQTTALHLATRAGNADVVRLLLEHGANVDRVNNYNNTALIIAADNSNYVIAGLLLAHGANVNLINDQKQTALMLAANRSVNRELLLLLLDYDANTEQRDKENRTALDYAKRYDHQKAIEILTTYSSTQPKNESFLFYAAQGYINKISKLLAQTDKPVDLEQLNDEGFTALMLAVRNNHIVVVTQLLKQGANANYAEKANGWTALMFAVKNGSITNITELLAHGADINQTDNNGYTALMLAVQHNQPEAVAKLLAQGSDVNLDQTDSKGRTALMLAIQLNQPKIVTMLLDQGADTSIVNKDGNTAIHLARIYGYSDIIKIFLEH